MTGFTIPNESEVLALGGSAAQAAAQAAHDAVDFGIMRAGIGGTGVIYGCAVTAQLVPDMTLAVAAGQVAVAGGSPVNVSAGNVTVAAAHASLPRLDIVAVDSSGVKSVIAGTPAEVPVFPAVPDTSVALTAVYVPATAVAIVPIFLVDKRTFVPPPMMFSVASFGARGDNSAVDNAAIAATIAAAPVGAGIFFPKPAVAWRLTSAVAVSKALTFWGVQSEIRQATNGTAGFTITASGVRFNGLKLVGTSTTYSDNARAFSFQGAYDAPLTDVAVVDCTVTTWQGYGIYGSYVTGGTITRNTVTGVGYAAILFTSAIRLRITLNHVADVVGVGAESYGIELTTNQPNDANSYMSADCIVSSNTATNVTQWAAFGTHGGIRITFAANDATNCHIGYDIVGAPVSGPYVGFAPKEISIIGGTLSSVSRTGTAGAGISIGGIAGGPGSGSTTDFATGTISGVTVIAFGTDNVGRLSGGLVMRNTLGLQITSMTFTDCSPQGINVYHDNRGFSITSCTFIDCWANASTVPGAIAMRDTYNSGTIGPNVELRVRPTTLAADASIGATTIKVATIDGWRVGDPIKVDIAGTVESRTVTSVGTAGSGGTGLGLSSALTGAHSSGAAVSHATYVMVRGVQASILDANQNVRVNEGISEALTPITDLSYVTPVILVNVGEVIFARRTTDSAPRNSSNTGATLTDDDQLLFPVAAGEVWFFELFALVDAAHSVMDVKFGLSVPAGTTASWGTLGNSNFISGYMNTHPNNTPIAIANAAGSVAAGTVAGGTNGNILGGVIKVGGTPGNVIIRWAQNTAVPEDLKLLEGSFLRATRMA